MLATMLSEGRAAALSLLMLAGCGAANVPRPSDAPDTDLFARVVVIGASASAGFMLEDSLADALEVALPQPHQPVLDLASELLFLAPAENGGEQVEQALAADPSLVIAIDFLFWFGYGDVGGDEPRIALLETGLALLERFDCPVVVGGFPDMSAAIGTMLRPEHVPSPAALARLEARLAEWARGRDDVVLVDLAGTLARLGSGEPVELFGRTWPPDDDELLQWDHLHPTDHGLVALAGIVLERVAAEHPRARITFDPGDVFAAID
jgi:hypothetical protein